MKPMAERPIQTREGQADGDPRHHRLKETIPAPKQDCGKIVQIRKQRKEANKTCHLPYNAQENCQGQNY